MVRSKFKCESVKKDGDKVNVELRAVTEGSEENKTFWKWTPTGYLQMSITNPDAYNQFETGKEYYVDFTPATEE